MNLIGLALWFPGVLSATPSRPALPQNFLPVPIIRQANTYSCGAAALAAVLHYWQVFDGPETHLYERLETTPNDGTEPSRIVKVAREFGLKAAWKHRLNLEAIESALKKGETVILDIQAWRDEASEPVPWKDTWEDGHYVVLIAMDQDNVYVMDPAVASGYGYMPKQELMDRWHDYEDRGGMVRRYHHLAIFIRGKNSLKGFPTPLTRLQ